MTNLEAALAYASWGWPVLPVIPNGKLPATAHGVHDATTDEATIRKWFEGKPDLNVAIAAGARSGLVVYDIDPRNGGDDSFAEWIKAHGALEAGALQLTAGGGQHYLAAYDDSIRSCKLVDGVDLLSDGRYFLAYPSTIEGRSYRWEVSSDPFDGVAPASIPDAWRAAMVPKPKPTASDGATLITGNRNNGLHALAGAMRYYGMGEAEILAALMVTNETRCDIPLPASEVRQLVHSAMKYDVKKDAAANAASGGSLIDALPLPEGNVPQEYYFTRATSFLSQPAPLEWAIKQWIPANGTSMVFGESGAGKTFVTLDMACSIAAGLDWMGCRTKAGPVVYMAGEGNYGVRQRVAAWCKHHGIEKLDNLLISNKAIDLDGPNAAAQIIRAVRELTDESAIVLFIDTTNNHMSGDENSARDVRNFFGAANVVAAALRSAVVLNHHVGHGDGAKGRARGSSAFKASLDAAIMVSKNDEGGIELSCVKMKDAEAPSPLHGKLEPVALGWVDEDGEEINGAVFVRTDEVLAPEPKIERKDSTLMNHKSLFQKAWYDSGAEMRDGQPYLSRSAMKAKLMESRTSKRTIENDLSPSYPNRLIGMLLNGDAIRVYEHGWIVVDAAWRNTMALSRKKEAP